MKNFLYLIDTSTVNLMVSLFIMTINRRGNLILRFVSEQGPLKDLKNFYTKEAYIGVMENEYQDEKSFFVKSFLPRYAKHFVVAAVKYFQSDKQNLNPFGIRILNNNMVMNLPKIQPIDNNDYVVLASMNSSSLKASNDIFSILTGNSKNCKSFEFVLSDDSKTFDIASIPIEKEEPLLNISIAKRNVNNGFCNYNEYKKMEFDENWRKKVIYTMDEYFIEESQKLIPRIDGTWNEEYIEGISFPLKEISQNDYTKNGWLDFLKKSGSFPIQI